MQLKDLDHIVWLQTGFLGDIILATAAFRFVRDRYPQLKQSLITTPLGALALKGHPDLDGLFVFDKRGRSLWSEGRRLRLALGETRGKSLILQCHRSIRSSLLSRIIGWPTITYDETQLAFLAKARVPRVAVLHEVQRILLLLEALGERREDFAMARPWLQPADSAVREKLQNFAGEKALIGIAPGSVWGTKRWPAENYGFLAQKILDRTDLKLVIIGSREENDAARDMLEKIAQDRRGRVLNLAGQTSLDDLRAVFPRLSLLIGNDSSPLHYASAFRIPTLAIFGATVPALGFGPLAPGSRVADIQLPCRPCSDHGPQICPLGHFQCMLGQSPEAIFQQSLAMLYGNTV